ncbi:tetratricopeptide repeat protein [Bdellovibrio sp. SKB1291214]|uniref:tetratricopeptide repeat protein n=1 Tax=Bdellovibrio sp. SKB1291214 TaxID=1732569 RepID=UPI000B51B774|nr:tetratricopeptide repeat protein [Bdellovibrio sp. SKB1291214]UYL07472.1 tetratricopeptide repeat protein [Bdellovibrio sp. SKB1291214]
MRWIPLLLLIAVLSACNSVKPETREQKMNRGFDYLDQQNYDQAVDYFQKLLKEDPHPQVRMALASAYAARAGVKFDSIYNFVVVKHKPVVRMQLAQLNFSEQTNEVIHNLEDFLAQWEQVPNVTKSGRSDLDKAVKVLSETDNAGARLYSAILRVVVLKANVGEGLLSWQLQAQSDENKLCLKDIRPWWQWCEKVLNSLESLGTDLEKAFPKKMDELKQYRAQLASFKTQMSAVSIPLGDACF